MSEKKQRTEKFSRVSELETLLGELNTHLSEANEKYLENAQERFSKIFVMGPLRSGTTLFTQWLANTGLVAYPTNMLSRFFGAPLVGAKIQQLLTDPRYNFRNEILDFNSDINFSSDNGKTKGALAPNEFWYFWRRFLPFDELDYMPAEELKKKANLAGFRDELNALANIFEKTVRHESHDHEPEYSRTCRAIRQVSVHLDSPRPDLQHPIGAGSPSAPVRRY